MSKTALIIGGTGPTGPPIVRGLQERGYRPIILHSGKHEVDEVGPDKLEHIHTDAHFAETLNSGLADRTFDIVIGTYGRLRLLPDVLKGRTPRLITIGGTIYRTEYSRAATEDSPRDVSHKIYTKIVETEQVLLDAHDRGVFNLTHLRYPNLYGPRQLAPREWSVIRRIRDGRKRLPILDAGLTLESRSYVDNAAHAVLLTVDQPDASAGQFYSVVDDYTPSDADRVHAMAAVMGAEVELISFPAHAGRPAWYWGIGRSLTWGQDETPPPTDHLLIDMGKMRRDVGYSDLVDFPEAIERTVRWYLDHPPEPGGEEERQLSDPFDYAAEDAYLDAYDRFVQECGDIPFEGIVYRHQYDHPKAPASSSTST